MGLVNNKLPSSVWSAAQAEIELGAVSLPPPCISEQPVAYAGDLGLGGETPCPLSTL